MGCSVRRAALWPIYGSWDWPWLGLKETDPLWKSNLQIFCSAFASGTFALML